MRRLRGLVTVVGAVAMMASASIASAAERTWTLPDTAEYRGAQIPAAEVLTKGLHCNAHGARVRCYDDPTVARSAAALQGGVVALASCSPGLTIWWDGPFAGSTLTLYTYPGWHTLAPEWRNKTSSWATGCRSGKLADLVSGGGAHLSMAANSSQGIMPLGWNDRADSLYRG